MNLLIPCVSVKNKIKGYIKSATKVGKNAVQSGESKF